MVISFRKVAPNIPCIVVESTTLERAATVKLLGVQLANDLSWSHHVEFIVKKAQGRLFCLNICCQELKMRTKDITAIFSLKIRHILEYTAQVWHLGLTMEQTKGIETIQKRAYSIATTGVDSDCHKGTGPAHSRDESGAM